MHTRIAAEMPAGPDLPAGSDTILRRAAVRTVYLFCALSAVVEGYNLQAGGMTAPKFSAEMGLAPGAVGLIFLLTSLGVATGAVVGGWCADRFGAKYALSVALALIGAGSVGTAFTSDPSYFTAMRILDGFGMGALLPNVITLLTNVGSPAFAPRRVTLNVAAISIGAGSIGLLHFFASPDLSWRTVFSVGGWMPIALAIGIILFLPRVEIRKAGTGTPSEPMLKILFGEGYRAVTLLFWLAFIITASVSYTLINWLPTFLARGGISGHEIGIAMICLSIGGALGPAVLAGLLRPGRVRAVVCLAYFGIIVGLLCLISASTSILLLCLAIGFSGFFTSGSQALLFGIVGPFYPAENRGVGVGSAVASGRLGSGLGPLLAGLMLGAGLQQVHVLAAAIPVLLAALGALVLVLRRQPDALKG